MGSVTMPIFETMDYCSETPPVFRYWNKCVIIYHNFLNAPSSPPPCYCHIGKMETLYSGVGQQIHIAVISGIHASGIDIASQLQVAAMQHIGC